MKKFIFIALLALTSQVFSESINVLFTSNKVVAKRNTVERTLARGSSLSPGDTVVTGAKAAANIKYSNGTLVNLGENSNYKIISYTPKAEVQLKTQLDTGKLRLKTTGKSKEEVQTPIAALAILGTDASIYVASSKSTYVNVTEGKVEARSSTVKAGDSALITKDGSSYAPFPKEGTVNTPAGAPGTISGGGPSSGVINTGAGPINDLETIALTTTESIGVSTAIASTSTTELIPIEIICP